VLQKGTHSIPQLTLHHFDARVLTRIVTAFYATPLGMAMCTDTLCHPEQSSNASSVVGEVTEYGNQRKRPTVRFSFMGRNLEDLTDDETDDSDDDEGSHSVVDDGSDDQQDHATPSLQSLEDEKRMIREQLLLITSELGQLTGADSAKVCLKSKNKRPHTFPDRKERQKNHVYQDLAAAGRKIWK